MRKRIERRTSLVRTGKRFDLSRVPVFDSVCEVSAVG